MNFAGRPERRMFVRRLAVSLLNLILVVLLGGFAAAALVRLSPGFDIDENSWNPRIGAATLAAMHARRERENRLPIFYVRYLGAALHGDLGQSESLRVPIAELLRERTPVTARLIGWGLAGGLLSGAFFAWLAVWPRRALLEVAAVSINGLLLAIPPGFSHLRSSSERHRWRSRWRWLCCRAFSAPCGHCWGNSTLLRLCWRPGLVASDP